MDLFVHQMPKNVETFSKTASYIVHIINLAELLNVESFFSRVLLAATLFHELKFGIQGVTKLLSTNGRRCTIH